MAREAVAVDFMGVGASDGGSDERGSSQQRLVRPIPSVPENRGRSSPAPEAPRDGSPFSTQGMRQPAWNKLPRFHSDDDNSNRVIVSPKRERETTDGPLLAHHPSLSEWGNSAPASPSHQPAGSLGRYEEFARMQQQARKAGSMYVNHQQGSRGVHNAGARTSPFRDEAQRGSQPSDRTGSEHHASLPSNSPSSFGSPTPFYGRMRHNNSENGGPMAGKRPPFQHHSSQAGHLPRPGGGGKQPRIAQLTIFYAGMVNVYDDVPFDKAQAIMLLAGSGNTWSSTNMSRPVRPFPAPAAVPQPTPSAPGSPAPQAPTTSAAVPPRPIVPGVVFSNVRQPPVNNVELPQARKASLARFLEKRKDRVRKVPVKQEGDASPSRDKSPSPSRGKPSTRSPSPTPAATLDHGSSPNGGLGHHHPPGATSCDEANSPTRPPQTPPRQSVSEEKNGGTPTKRREYEIEQDSNKRARTGRSPLRTDDDR